MLASIVTLAGRGAAWVLGALTIAFVVQRAAHKRGIDMRDAARSLGGTTGKLLAAFIATFAVEAGLRYGMAQQGIAHTATDVVYWTLLSAVAFVLSLFLGRQFQAPPWWSLNAWNPGASEYDGSFQRMGAWVVRDARQFVLDLYTGERVAMVVGGPLLVLDSVQAIGADSTFKVLYSILLLGFVSLAVALVAANRIPRVLMERLNDLRLVAGRIARGELAARADVGATGQYEELTQLASDFNTMAKALEQRNAENQQLQYQLSTALQGEQERATRDPLTKMRNRGYFQESLTSEIDRCSRTGANVTVAIMDLDNFKQVNDRYGHQEGDAVLLRFAHALQTTLRPYDLACRLGGEEFGVIFPETSTEDAQGVLARVAETFRPCGPHGQAASFSAGIAAFPTHAADHDDLYHKADEAAYTAKLRGKDQSVIYSHADVIELDSAEHQRQKELQSMLSSAKTLVSAVDAKDTSSGGEHSERVAQLAKTLALGLGLSNEDAQDVYLAGLLHDVGKIGIPDDVLLKPGRLSPAEYAQMQQHPELGYRIVLNAGLPHVAQWVRHHHEHWDGSGYPARLRGEEIPLASRIVLVAEAFDVMTSSHPYRVALPLHDALNELMDGAGNRFDPQVVQILVNLARSGEVGGPDWHERAAA